MRDSQVRGAMEIALFIQNIQEERAEVWVWPGKNLPRTISKRRKNTEKIAQQITGKIYVQVALYIFTNQSDSNMTEVKYNENRFVIISYHKEMIL